MPIGIGDAAQATFPLIRQHTFGSAPSIDRPIYLPDAASFVVKLDSVAADPADYTLNRDTVTPLSQASVTFDPGKEPGAGVAVTWSGDFDYPVRFNSDASNFRWETVRSWTGIQIVERYQ